VGRETEKKTLRVAEQELETFICVEAHNQGGPVEIKREKAWKKEGEGSVWMEGGCDKRRPSKFERGPGAKRQKTVDKKGKRKRPSHGAVLVA